ncbi:hypothetical protein [Sphingobacterium chungjuense]|uniref:hypothetical protein n=1 Tax=Sphingobacterium chungjuense TaxID=2675553 RepID=UPI00140B7018|nr:hypothetical protein [Sphingobacterium chungjuense]
MRWIFWFFVVNVVSFVALMKGLIGDGNMFVGAFIAFAAWGLFLRAIFASQENKRKMKNREQMIDEYLRQQLRK